MTVNISKPAINVREKLSELDKPTGIAGEAMLRAETPQEQFNLIGAGRRNMIINGSMGVAQRSTSVASISTNGYHVCDRWVYKRDGTEVITMSQENDAPAGFKYSTKILVTTADTSLPAGTHIRLGTRLEAQDVRQLAHGTVEAKQATVSFWVKSNKTGSYSLGLYKGGLSGNTISQGYTVNSSGTWEYKTLTFSADTSAGFNSSDIGEGLRVWFTLGANSDRSSGLSNTWSTSTTHRAVGQGVNLLDAVNNYWQITGVQLEVGKVATPFEHRSYGEELALCQRYYYQIAGNNRLVGYGFAWNANEVNVELQLPQVMRASPTVGFSNNANDFVFSPYDAYFSTFTAAQFWAADIGMRINLYKSGGGFSNPITQGKAGYIRMMNNTTSKITVDAEL